ncbi:MAG: tetratricopeptide repeat protein [Sphingomonadaceae bacterium]
MNHINSETMANREELGIIRGARAGDAGCQLALGKLYLFGGASLPRSMPTALHWLSRAAKQQLAEAWMLIGTHIPFEHARHCQPVVWPWYEHAHDAGVAEAGLVLAQLVLSPAGESAPPALRAKALAALEWAARSGSAEAQWLLARQTGVLPAQQAGPAGSSVAGTVAASNMAERAWLAGGSGLLAAQYAMLEQAWVSDAPAQFLQRAQPLLHSLLRAAPADAEAARAADWPLTAQQVTLLGRCASLIDPRAPFTPQLQQCRELAAYGGERQAQLALGLWFARMTGDGERLASGIAAVNFKRAIRWLTLAGDQGLAAAWFALARIYIKPEFSQRCVAEAQAYLERAAEMGHRTAQLECGMHAWRTRRGDANSDVRAAYWLQKAALQGCAEADAALARIASPPKQRGWADSLVTSLSRELLAGQPLLAARIELAELFGLSRAEALLLDLKAADHGHCLVVDIRASYGRSKRRLILLRTAHERQVLDRLQRLFDTVDSGPDGIEGNYRQRLYRLKTWLPQAAGELLAA